MVRSREVFSCASGFGSDQIKATIGTLGHRGTRIVFLDLLVNGSRFRGIGLTKQIGEMTYVAWRFGRTTNVMVARQVPMHRLFRLGCHTCEREEGKVVPPSTDAL